MSTSGRSTFTTGYVLATLSAAILSTTSIMIRYLTQTYAMPALVLAFWRAVFVVVTLLPVLGLARALPLSVKRRHLPFLVAHGLILACFNSLWTLSVTLNGAAVATVLAYSSAGFTALLGWRFLNEQLGWAKLLAVAICLAGCVLVSEALDPAAWGANLVGILTGIFTGLGYAVYSLMGRSASQRGLNPWTNLLYAFGFAAVFLAVFNLLPGITLPGAAAHPGDFFWLRDSLPGWGILILLAAGPTVIGFGLYNVSMGYLPSSIANLILTTEPVFTALLAFFLLGERLKDIQWVGGLMILMGVVFLRVYDDWVMNHALSLPRSARKQT